MSERGNRSRRRNRKPRELDTSVAASERNALDQLYERGRDHPVAFVDESFRLNSPGKTFYVMSAALFEGTELAARRTLLTQLTGGTVLHATDWFRDGKHDELAAALDWAETNVGWHFITVEIPVPHGEKSEDARRSCLRTLLHLLAENKVHTVILDTRGRHALDNHDQTVARELRRKREIPLHAVLRHVDDRVEPLLGCADLVAWSCRRLLANDDVRWWPHISDVTTVFEAGTREEILLRSASVLVDEVTDASTPRP